MKRQKKKFVPNRSSTPTHDLPEVFRKKIETLGGTKVNLVIEKTLYKSDLVQGENRLSMPFKQIRSKFLEDDEVRRLANYETLTVPLIDTMLQEREICLSRWSLHTSKWYVLKTQWYKKIVLNNGLRKGDLIQVWSFRDKVNNLHLALVLVERKGEDI
ncbi:B3 domain-containing protein At2g32645-like [Rosa rugosa]|uniref:B3 domain-containing protein At2g32645-like n=1 Tax=Rosa rugosa TaxID=74645 RepID=UPI002B40DAC3|nr:B3 domain-containing protein At2g32645-like [Rosa rugosa]